MPNGTIKKLINHRGYGFIDSDIQDSDIFFHASKLVGLEFDNLSEGDEVEFEVTETEKGPEAIDIKLVGGADVEEADDDFDEFDDEIDEEFDEETTTDVLDEDAMW